MRPDDILDMVNFSYLQMHSAFISDKDENIYHNRCYAIARELEKFDITADVHRHHLFDVNYIVVIFDREENGFIADAEEKISRILNIPVEWIGMVNCCDPQQYFIKEREFMQKHPSANTGVIDFEENEK